MGQVPRFIIVLSCLILLLGCAEAKDTTPPTAPTHLSKTSPDNDNTPTFAWDAAIDDASAIDYYLVNILTMRTSGGEGVGVDWWKNVRDGTTYECCEPVPYISSTLSVLSDGDYTFKVIAVDKAGNESITATLAFTVDTTPPTTPTNLIRTSPDNDNTPTSAWDAATGDASGIDYYMVGIYAIPTPGGGEVNWWVGVGDTTIYTCSDSPPWSSTVTSVVPDGDHTFKVKAVDKAGNESAAATLTFTIDTSP